MAVIEYVPGATRTAAAVVAPHCVPLTLADIGALPPPPPPGVTGSLPQAASRIADADNNNGAERMSEGGKVCAATTGLLKMSLGCAQIEHSASVWGGSPNRHSLLQNHFAAERRVTCIRPLADDHPAAIDHSAQPGLIIRTIRTERILGVHLSADW